VASLGGNKLNVTDPVGAYPPARVAVSVKVTPIPPPAPGVVLIVGLACVTTTGSDAQVLVAVLLFPSPLYVAVQCQVPTAFEANPGAAYGAVLSVTV
jgi:hypothetical protein